MQDRAATVFGEGKQEQIAGWIGGLILNGRAAPGSQLPTVAAVRERFGVAAGTVQCALARLREAGLIESTRGGGIYVAERPACLGRLALVFAHHPGAAAAWSSLHDALLLAVAAGQTASQVETVFDADAGAQARESLSARLAACHFGGVIMGDAAHVIGSLPFRRSWGIPAVAIMAGPPADSPELPAVYPDFAAWIAAALGSLLAAGARRPALILSARPSYLRALDRCLAAAPELRAALADWRVQAVPPDQPAWAARLAGLLLRLPPDQRPDGLAVLDDVLRAPVAAALAAAPADQPRPALICYANFPCPPAGPPLLPGERRLGCHAADILAACLDQIACQQRGEAPRPFSPVAPVFDPA